MMVRAAPLVIAALLAAWGFAPAAPAATKDMLTLRVGPRYINCYRLPCPPWGQMAISLAGPDMMAATLHPLYAGDAPPPIIGTTADRLRLERAFRRRACLLVRGRIEKRPAGGSASTAAVVLILDRILRPC
jgi:hypothetical protein